MERYIPRHTKKRGDKMMIKVKNFVNIYGEDILKGIFALPIIANAIWTLIWVNQHLIHIF